MIQLLKHKVHQDAIDNVVATLKSGWTGLGPRVEEFEKEIAAYLNTPYAITTSSGTTALQLAILSLKATSGGIILTTPLTFISTNQAITLAGLHPVFCDIEPTTGNIDVKSVERLLNDSFIRPRVKAIMVVHYAGMPVDLDGIYDFSIKHNIDIIEDAAHAFGAEYTDERIGCLHSKLVCFSFHSVKPLAIGDGGMIATHDPAINEFARKMRWCGINKNTAERFKTTGYRWDYDVEYVGYKAHMNDIQAAIGLGQLKHYEEDKRYRQTLVDKYRELLRDEDKIELLQTFDNRKSANHLFVIKLATHELRDKVAAYLYEHDIQTGCHYRPNHLYKIYRKADSDGGCPNAVEFFERCLTLPLHLDLTLEDIEIICDTIQEVL